MNTIQVIAHQNETLEQICKRTLNSVAAIDWVIKHNPAHIDKIYLKQGDIINLPDTMPTIASKERVQLWS